MCRCEARSSFVRSLTQGLQQSSERRHDDGRQDDRRQEVRDPHVADAQKFETHTDDEQAADRAHLPQLEVAQKPDEQRRADREPALIEKDERDREENAPAERRGQRDGGEPVECALDDEEARVAGEAVLDRPKKRERADATYGRGGDERFGHGAGRAAREAPLQRLAELVEPRVDPQERADDPTEQYRAEYVEKVRRLDREFDPHREQEQADAPDNVLPQSLAQTIAEDRAEKTTDEHCRGVEKCSGEGGHEGP